MTKRYLETPKEVIDALQDGKEIRDSEGRVWKLYNGCVIRKDKSGFWSVNTPINAHFDGLYAYDTESLKLEIGKFYKTRSGNKVIVLYVNKNDISGFPVSVAVVGSPDTLYFVSRTGGHSNGFTNEWDIVEPLEE